MTPNDISTPKKAEDATRHPLASLAYIREALVDFRMDHPHVGSSALDRAEIELESLESALRAQAEAEAGLRAEADTYFGMIEHLVHELRTIEDGADRALSRLGSSRRMHQNSPMKTVKSLVVCALDVHERKMRKYEDAKRERARAALAQAGGES